MLLNLKVNDVYGTKPRSSRTLTQQFGGEFGCLQDEIFPSRLDIRNLWSEIIAHYQVV